MTGRGPPGVAADGVREHKVATRPAGITVGELADALGIGQPTVSHHVRKLADVGFVSVHKNGTSTVVTINPTCCTGLPHAADAVMGVLTSRPCCPADLPTDASVRAMRSDDWEVVLSIYGEGIATRMATFATEVPDRETLDAHWLSGHRWVAEIDGEIVGWAALAPASSRDCYRGVAEDSIYVTEGMRGRGVGKALLHKQVIAADEAGLWTLQTSIFPENRASIALHHSAGYRTIGVRERIARLDGVWRDTVLLERRSPAPDRRDFTKCSLVFHFDDCQYRCVSKQELLITDVSIPLCEVSPLVGEPLTPEAATELAAVFKALSDPVRLRLFSLIASRTGGEACVCDVSDGFDVSQPTISHHLKVLRESGLLSSQRRGSWVYYRVDPAVLAQLSHLLSGTGEPLAVRE